MTPGFFSSSDQLGPIRLRKPPLALLHPGPGEQPVLKRVVGQVARQRPVQPRRSCTLQIILHSAARYAQPLGDLSRARSVTGKPQHLS